MFRIFKLDCVVNYDVKVIVKILSLVLLFIVWVILGRFFNIFCLLFFFENVVICWGLWLGGDIVELIVIIGVGFINFVFLR